MVVEHPVYFHSILAVSVLIILILVFISFKGYLTSAFLQYLVLFVYFVAMISYIYCLFMVMRIMGKTEKSNVGDYDLIFKRVIQPKKPLNTPDAITWKTSHGYISIGNPYRHIFLVGSPGAGKSYTIIEPIIDAHMQAGRPILLYDFKFPTLGEYAYNSYSRALNDGVWDGKKRPEFYTIYFKDPRYSHQLNPIPPSIITDMAMAREAMITVLYAINRSWPKKEGDFFTDSAITLATACLWYLRKKAVELNINICTLPHLIKFASGNGERVITLLMQEKDIQSMAVTFKTAMENSAGKQLAGQISSLQTAMSKLLDKGIFWVMSRNSDDKISLDINSKDNPNTIILGNDDKLSQVYAPALSLYGAMLAGTINQKGRVPCGVVADEFATLYMPPIDKLLNLGRSNKISITIGIQSTSQMQDTYGKEKADNIMNGCSSIFIMEVAHEATAKWASAFFGKELFTKKSISVNQQDTSISVSEQYEEVLPPHKIMSMKRGMAVGKVSDPEKEAKASGFARFFQRKETELREKSKLFAGLIEIEKPKDYNNKIPKTIRTNAATEEEELQIIQELLDANEQKIGDEIERLITVEYWQIVLKNQMRYYSVKGVPVQPIQDLYFYLLEKGTINDFLYSWTLIAENEYLKLLTQYGDQMTKVQREYMVCSDCFNQIHESLLPFMPETYEDYN